MLKLKVNFDTSGFKGLVNEMQTRRITRLGVKTAIGILEGAARVAAPKRSGSGALQRAQWSIVKAGKKGKTISFAVQGAVKKAIWFVRLKGYRKPQKVRPEFYDHLVLGGTRAHRLGSGEKLARLAGVSKLGRVYRKAIAATAQTTGRLHPGSKPNPYRKRAWNIAKDRAAQAALKKMGEATQRAIAKAAVRGK